MRKQQPCPRRPVTGTWPHTHMIMNDGAERSCTYLRLACCLSPTWAEGQRSEELEDKLTEAFEKYPAAPKSSASPRSHDPTAAIRPPGAAAESGATGRNRALPIWRAAFQGAMGQLRFQA